MGVSLAQPASFGAAPRPSTMRSTSRCDLGVTRLASDVEAYNHAADGVCQKNSVDVIDLHAFTLARLAPMHTAITCTTRRKRASSRRNFSRCAD